ncbi:PAS domain S-box-containing protein [Actinoplanes lutulentus]|uniref:PAS domain S-box-containing protein n=1 Tax=Actinoplanes lutulentus TaxID=1287878 RepID=A0A327ZL64_9ACTN|nr:PAS domain S-box protein [Actinoplanes lutulentus]MBB2942025.1 PAS domain S-box-containing protein [Actinoplanes lutulentus]RAK39937.1 PAS domain S-box-containing protein [Actinoplanes lutulentus]
MLRAIEWILLGAGSVAAILYGVRRHRPARKAPWLLLAGAVATLSAGDVFYAYRRMDLAEVCYLAMFALVVVCLLQFTRDGSMLADRARLIDLVAFSCSTLLVVWVFVIGSAGQMGAVNAADVIGDLLLTGVSVRLVLADRRNVAAILLLAGGLGMLAGDIFYPLTTGSFAAETTYVALYLCWGLSALHPSMVRLTEPRPPEPTPWRIHWTVLLAASAATPPAVLLIEALNNDVRDGVVIAVTGAITLLLTITRLADAIRQHSAALNRERGLRTANTALVAAADQPAVDAAVRTAIIGLLPPGSVSRVLLATDDGRLAAESLPPAPAGSGSRSWWAPAEDPDECVLICPLRLEPLAVARPSGGALILTGRKEALTACRDALEVLAGETALALDRITLVEAVGRRDSDLYLRAVIRNTAEIMAVIDSDHRIRYASPELRRLLGGDELPPLIALDDLVHPDDQAMVRVRLRAEGDGKVFCALRRKDDTQAFVEMTYRDLRDDRLVQGLVVTMKDITDRHDPGERVPYQEVGEMPAQVNRRSAQHKFRF